VSLPPFLPAVLGVLTFDPRVLFSELSMGFIELPLEACFLLALLDAGFDGTLVVGGGD
jgi:hypothetical protein